MKNQTSTIQNRKSTKAFTLVECLIGLAISAMLLAAVAVAFNASLVSYTENEDMFHAINDARQAMARMTAQIRTAGYLHPTQGMLTVQYPGTSNNCELWTPQGDCIRYEFQSPDPNLYLVKISNTTEEKYVLCSNVVSAEFTKMPATDPNDCKSVQIKLTVQCGDVSRTLAAAAVVRRNLDS